MRVKTLLHAVLHASLHHHRHSHQQHHDSDALVAVDADADADPSPDSNSPPSSGPPNARAKIKYIAALPATRGSPGLARIRPVTSPPRGSGMRLLRFR